MRPRPAAVLAIAMMLLMQGCSGAHAPEPAAPNPPSSGSTKTTDPTRAPAPQRLVVATEPWRLPYPLAREAVVPVSGSFVVAGGLVAGDRSTDQVFTLDPGTGHTRAAAPLAVPVHDTAGIAFQGRLLVVGGGNATEQDVVQVRIGKRWSVAGHLPQPRSDLTTAVVGPLALVLGGYDATTVAVPSVLASTDGAHWRALGNLPVPVRYAAGVARGHAVWLFGGERAGVMQTAVQRVDASGRARVVARLPQALGHASAVALGARILLVGGRTASTAVTARMWWFDPASRSFTRAGRLPRPLSDSAVAVGPDGAYLVGGESPSLTDRVVRVVLR